MLYFIRARGVCDFATNIKVGESQLYVGANSIKGHLAGITKSIVAEMTPLQKLSQRAMRTELRRKAIRFPAPRPAGGKRKTVQCCLEKICGRAIERQIAINELPSNYSVGVCSCGIRSDLLE